MIITFHTYVFLNKWKFIENKWEMHKEDKFSPVYWEEQNGIF